MIVFMGKIVGDSADKEISRNSFCKHGPAFLL